MMSHTQFICMTLSVSDISCRNHFGKRFFVSFFRNLTIDEEIYILVLTDHDKADLEFKYLTAYNMDLGDVIIKRTVSRSSPRKINIRSIFGLTGILRNASVGLEASNEVSVTAGITGKVTRASYLALPDHVLGKEYLVATFCDLGTCACSVTSMNPHTHIFLRLKSGMSMQVHSDIPKNYNDGQIYIDTKEKPFHTVYIESNGDLSGLSITSDNFPLAVVCGEVSAGYVRSMEQLLPTSEFGVAFYAYPKPETHQSYVKFVANYDCTTITINSLEFVLNAREVGILTREQIGDKKIESDAPIIVVQLFASGTNQGLIIVPAIHQYLDNYIFPGNIDNPYASLRIGMLAYLDFNFKIQKDYTETFLKSKTSVISHITDVTENGVALKLNSPSHGPFLLYILRQDINQSLKSDIMANSAGFNFTQRQSVYIFFLLIAVNTVKLSCHL